MNGSSTIGKVFIHTIQWCNLFFYLLVFVFFCHIPRYGIFKIKFWLPVPNYLFTPLPPPLHPIIFIFVWVDLCSMTMSKSKRGVGGWSWIGFIILWKFQWYGRSQIWDYDYCTDPDPVLSLDLQDFWLFLLSWCSRNSPKRIHFSCGHFISSSQSQVTGTVWLNVSDWLWFVYILLVGSKN